MGTRSLLSSETNPTSEPNRSAAILVIDANVHNRLLLQTAVKWYGYKALVARNGAEGFTTCSTHRDIKAIVCDIDPVMGGLVFIEQIQRVKPNARVIVSTRAAGANLRHSQTSKIVRATLRKPYSIGELWATLERVLCDENHKEVEGLWSGST